MSAATNSRKRTVRTATRNAPKAREVIPAAGGATLIESRAGRSHRRWGAMHRGRKPGGDRQDADKDVFIARRMRTCRERAGA